MLRTIASVLSRGVGRGGVCMGSTRGMHVPGAAQPGVKYHQITGTKAHRPTTIRGDGDITLQQQAGLLLVVGGMSCAIAPPPQGLSHEQWWLAEKLSRRPTSLPLLASLAMASLFRDGGRGT